MNKNTALHELYLIKTQYMLFTDSTDDLSKITKGLESLRLNCTKSVSRLHDNKVIAEKLRRGIKQKESELGRM